MANKGNSKIASAEKTVSNGCKCGGECGERWVRAIVGECVGGEVDVLRWQMRELQKEVRQLRVERYNSRLGWFQRLRRWCGRLSFWGCAWRVLLLVAFLLVCLFSIAFSAW